MVTKLLPSRRSEGVGEWGSGSRERNIKGRPKNKFRTYALTENNKYISRKNHISRRGLALLNPYPKVNLSVKT
jgi:hypothetical protein